MKTHEYFQDGDSPVLMGARRARAHYALAKDDLLTEARTLRAMSDCEDRMHAVRSGLAGLAGAVHVLTDQSHDLPEASRRRVESLLVGEIERLLRVAAPRVAATVEYDTNQLDLDEVMADLVLARRMAGQIVNWEPSGHLVVARHDDVVEVLNILLVNAARHAEGSTVSITASHKGGGVRVSVADDGPGVPLAMRRSIFERGFRHRESPGQGLGLAIASELMAELGGSLELVDSAGGGACFELVLPSLVMEGAA